MSTYLYPQKVNILWIIGLKVLYKLKKSLILLGLNMLIYIKMISTYMFFQWKNEEKLLMLSTKCG